MSETSLSVKGQIVIPLRVRERMGLRVGQRFEIETMSDGTILLIPVIKNVIDVMELPAAEKLERALMEERKKEEEKHEAMTKEFKGR